MKDLHDDLAQAHRAAPPSTLDLERLATRRDRRSTRRRVGASVVALAVTLAIVVGAVSALSRQGAGNGGSSTAASDGFVFGPPSDVSLADGQYVYTRTTTTFYTSLKDSVDRYSEKTETWWATDDSGRIEAWSEGQGTQSRMLAAGEFGTGEYRSNFGSIAGLSTDPATLEQQLIDLLQSDGKPGASPFMPTPAPGGEYPLGERMIMAANGLLESSVSPELKAALFQVLADQPGVTVVREGTDPVGRPAIELRWNDVNNAWMQRVWFDAQTQQPTAWGQANVLPAGESPPTYILTIVQRAGIVDSTSSTDLVTPFFPSTNQPPPVPDWVT